MSPTYARRILKKIGIGLLIALILLILGLMIGYGVGGGNPFRVFLPSTWQHIADFLK